MNRKHFGLISGGVLAATIATTGCGGRVDGIEELTADGPNSGAPGLGAESSPRVYFGMTNTIDVERPSAVTFDLAQGSRVEVLVATRDASKLVLDIAHIRRDGPVELLSPVSSDSGFHLTTFEAKGGAHRLRFFPKDRQTIVIHLECKSGEGMCSPAKQPGQSCNIAFPCDDGLACVPVQATSCKGLLLEPGTCALHAGPDGCSIR
jgi:hypothetical protein